MKTAGLIRWVRTMSAKRMATLALGSGLLALGLDAGIAHFAGREMKSAVQLVPVIAAPLGFIALSAIAAKDRREVTVRSALRIAGFVLASVGALGTLMHVLAFLRLLEGTAVTMKSIELALAVAPPIAAPGAFLAIGGILAVLASPRVSLTLVREETAPAPKHPPLRLAA